LQILKVPVEEKTFLVFAPSGYLQQNSSALNKRQLNAIQNPSHKLAKN
jgi:hypothetical protein